MRKENLGLILVLVAILIAGAVTMALNGCDNFTLVEILDGEE